jgi:hypothetical protein
MTATPKVRVKMGFGGLTDTGASLPERRMRSQFAPWAAQRATANGAIR